MNNSSMSYFLLRRVHSLLGVFPLGIFLFNHLLTNATGIVSPKFFEEKVALIHMLGPILPFVEAAFIFIPLSLHIALGIYIALQARIEVGSTMPYGRNWAYALQRWTGWIALIFIVYHVLHLRFLHDMEKEPFSIVLGYMFGGSALSPLFVLGYLVGSLAVIYHFANGLCTFCMTWGLTVGPKSQMWMARVATGVGAGLTLLLLTAIAAFARDGMRVAGMNEVERAAYIAELQSVHNH
jgi:succinate dehydrogenase / fumarate reductase cytochrome b subunit